MSDFKHALRWFLVLCLGLMGAYCTLVILGSLASFGLSALRQLLR